MGGVYSTHGRDEKCIPVQNLVGKPEGKRLVGRHKRMTFWKDNIKVDCKDRVRGCGLDLSGLG
jgi:hypothetical protein